MSRRLFNATFLVGANTGISRVLGLVRDIVIARMFGASLGADAFFVAFRVPNFLRRLFAEGAFAQAFVPVLSEYKVREGPDRVRDLVAHTAGTLGLVVCAVSGLGVLIAPWLVYLFAPGFADQPDKFALTGDMLRLTFPYLLFISLTALAGSVLNTFGRFAVPAFTPVLLNLSLIGAATLLAPRMQQPVLALAIGVFVAGAAQLLFQLPFLRAIGMLTWPRIRRAHAGVSRIVRLMAPAMFGVSVSQINLLVDTIIASFLVTGSVSWLYYSDRLVEFPLGVFGIALATVILPGLSKQHAQADPAAFNRTLDWALRLTVVIALPAAVGLVALAEPMLATMFQYQAFSPRDVYMASLSLTAYALGLPAFILIKVLAPGYFSRQDTRTPVRVGVVAMLVNIVLNLALVWHLAHAGLALATALSAYLNAGLLYRGLRRDGVLRPLPGWRRILVKVSIASVLMLAGVLLLSAWFGSFTQLSALTRAATLGALVAAGAGIYFLALRVQGVTVAMLRNPVTA